MSTQSEAKFSTEVIKFFDGKLSEVGLQNKIKAAERVKILKDLTIGQDRDKQWRLIAGFQQQDIVFYSPEHAIPMEDFTSKVLRIDKYDKTGQTPVIIPLVICELKIGYSTTTHALITYSSISAQLRNIFPHCGYYFIMDSNKERGMQPETVLRHSKGFDRVFLSWKKERERVWHDIWAHLEYLAELKLIKLS